MAAAHGEWDRDDRQYSTDSYSDDSPILSYRYDRRQYASTNTREGKEERERRSTLSILAKFFLFSSAMILFCMLMYIPVYNKANYQLPKGTVKGWSVNANRDTKLYVQPNNVTTIHQPIDVCTKDTNKKHKLFLLIVVCSSTVNFERRLAIRETWGSHKNYLHTSKIFKLVKKRYEKYNYTYDLYPNETEKVVSASADLQLNLTDREKRQRRDINGFGQLLPELAKALNSDLATAKIDEEKTTDSVGDESLLPEFDMNEVIVGEKDTDTYDYNYESNIMKIPPKGEEDLEESSWDKILKLMKKKSTTLEDNEEDDNTEKDFKLVFLLGLPSKNHSLKVQSMIEAEVKQYGDIIQEGFVDSYNNLTLKSIMMLKWVTHQCNESVRYVLKTDDDMYINVPNLMEDLRNRSKSFDRETERFEMTSSHYQADANGHRTEHLLIGDLITGARPVLDSTNKWYSPRYMYAGTVYPPYVSGTGYVLSAPTARALYHAALRTRYFHLEDIYITGVCAMRASPPLRPRDDPLFSYRALSPGADAACWAHAHATAHHLAPARMRHVCNALREEREVDRCERIRLTEVRRERMRPKPTPRKKLSKIALTMS